ncbi:methyltransferase domain-containing protein [Sulfitobacter sp. W027]|jgi:predicted TPR repeat methyltransferase|uniref:class I SAM-dependent DNA methyltransferase n=1 Tax=Sulfitobacter sp. W027 TaxID=2867025 RepID=UPI0021A30B6C|nr:methyltransferase domain-containing protein [Sulfitobacter sp. W027]UWR34799.1 methyltransferase domain-containing protein [Sulfitobacter sp. W027]
MTQHYLDKAYASRDTNVIRSLYDEWASSYDEDIKAQGYATPERAAVTLAEFLDNKDAPIFDIGCGTGLSGEALKKVGFTTIDGGDISAAMLNEARIKGIYRNLLELEVDAPLPFAPGTYTAITAIGVIGPGAAPITLFDTLMHGLGKGGKLLFSLNEKALADRGALGMIHEWTDCGAAILLHAEEGAHLPGINLKSTVYLIEKN